MTSGGAGVFFAERVAQIPLLRRRAEEAGIDHIGSFVDLVPLLITEVSKGAAMRKRMADGVATPTRSTPISAGRRMLRSRLRRNSTP